MKVAVVIPARFQSSRFPGKPLISIDGITLIERTYRRVQACTSVDIIVVATDDDRIEKHVESFGGLTCKTSKECQTGSDRVGEAYCTNRYLQEADVIINVQGDEPCISPVTIQKVIDLLVKDTNIDIVTAVSPISVYDELISPNVVKCTLSQSNRILYLSRLPIPGNKKSPLIGYDFSHYKRHIGVYGYRKKSLEKFISLEQTPLQQQEDIEIIRALEHDMNVSAVHIDSHAPGVDVPEDILLVESWLQKESGSDFL